MTPKDFDKLTKQLRQLCDNIMLDKRPEYTERNSDVLHNFNLQASELGLDRKMILYVFFRKHISSIAQYCAGKYNSNEPISNRIADAINYLTLLYGMHVEVSDDSITMTGTIGSSGSCCTEECL